MAPINDETVSRIRSMWRKGLPSSELLRFLDSKGLHTVEMIACFRAAFGLDFGDARCIGGWFADGTGELDDNQIHKLLAPVIEAKRRQWELLDATSLKQ